MQVSSIMTSDPVWASQETTLDEALALMDQHDIRHLPVLEDGQLVGVISNRDLLEATGWLPSRVHACRGPGVCDHLSKRVKDIMGGAPVLIAPDDSVAAASIQLVQRGIGCLPVVADGVLVGMLTEMDLLDAYINGQLNGQLTGGDEAFVKDHMTDAPRTVHWYTALGSAIAICRSNGVRHLPVMEAGQLVGIVSDRDLRKAVGAGRHEDMLVDEIVTRDLSTIPSAAPLSQAAKIMLERKISSLPVMDDDAFVGLLTLSDVLEHCLDSCTARGEAATRTQ